MCVRVRVCMCVYVCERGKRKKKERKAHLPRSPAAVMAPIGGASVGRMSTEHHALPPTLEGEVMSMAEVAGERGALAIRGHVPELGIARQDLREDRAQEKKRGRDYVGGQCSLSPFLLLLLPSLSLSLSLHLFLPPLPPPLPPPHTPAGNCLQRSPHFHPCSTQPPTSLLQGLLAALDSRPRLPLRTPPARRRCSW